MDSVINHHSVISQADNKLDFHSSKTSYSPMFSSIGLVSDDDISGIGSLWLHYNRKSRPLWNDFLIFDSDMKISEAKLSSLRYSSADNKKSAVLAFCEPDCFVVSARNTGEILLMGAPSEDTVDAWIEQYDEKMIILHGYSKNGDSRDPDVEVPFAVGVCAVNGHTIYENGQVKLCPDNQHKADFVFAVQALDIDFDKLQSRLFCAPQNAADAEKLCEKWVEICLLNFSAEGKTAAENELLIKAVKGLLFNLVKGQGNLKHHISAYPNRGTYPAHFMWDSCFQNLALEQFNPKLAKESLLQFVDNQRCDGKFAQFLCSTWSRPNDAQPALVGWAAMRIVEKTGDLHFAEKMLPALERNNRWWLNQRMTRYGVLYCPSGLETGQDDSPRFDSGEILALDMNSYLLSQFNATAKLAQLLSLDEKAAEWKKCARQLSDSMLKCFYDEEKNLFYDADRSSGERLSILSLSAFLPLWAGISLDTEKAHRMIRDYLLNENCFLARYRFRVLRTISRAMTLQAGGADLHGFQLRGLRSKR